MREKSHPPTKQKNISGSYAASPLTTAPSALTTQEGEKRKKVAIIGGGWFGAHTAIHFSNEGWQVVLHEKNGAIFSETSGTFGVRIHAGPHYPRSYSTRKTCRDGFNEMLLTYRAICNDHLYSVYALGKEDADGNPSKVTAIEFDDVCKEFKRKETYNLKEKQFFDTSTVSSAYNINEPSAVLGSRLRAFFQGKLKRANVTIKYNFKVTRIEKSDEGILVGNERESEKFDKVVDATGFQQKFLPLPTPLPFEINVFYQPCLALVYRDKAPTSKPISFIVMDGWFPCLMPYDDRLTTENPIDKYIMTHGKYTIMGSYTSAEKAHAAYKLVNDEFIAKKVRPKCEKEMLRFWPDFFGKFEYAGWKGSVLAKMKTEREFRGSVVFQEPTVGMISIFPGKITNIFDSAREALKLAEAPAKSRQIKTTKVGYRYVEGGVLDASKQEITDPIVTDSRNTCSLRTYQDEPQERKATVAHGYQASSKPAPSFTSEPTSLLRKSSDLLSLLSLSREPSGFMTPPQKHPQTTSVETRKAIVTLSSIYAILLVVWGTMNPNHKGNKNNSHHLILGTVAFLLAAALLYRTWPAVQDKLKLNFFGGFGIRKAASKAMALMPRSMAAPRANTLR